MTSHIKRTPCSAEILLFAKILGAASGPLPSLSPSSCGSCWSASRRSTTTAASSSADSRRHAAPWRHRVSTTTSSGFSGSPVRFLWWRAGWGVAELLPLGAAVAPMSAWAACWVWRGFPVEGIFPFWGTGGCWELLRGGWIWSPALRWPNLWKTVNLNRKTITFWRYWSMFLQTIYIELNRKKKCNLLLVLNLNFTNIKKNIHKNMFYLKTSCV